MPLNYAKQNNKKVVIIDTAGRLAVDEAMMNEIAEIKSAIKPNRNFVCGRFHDGSGCGKYGQNL